MQASKVMMGTSFLNRKSASLGSIPLSIVLYCLKNSCFGFGVGG